MRNCGVLKGKAVQYKRDDDEDPHSGLLMNVDGEKFRVAINVRSSRGPVQKRLIEYLVVHDLRHRIIDGARELLLREAMLRQLQIKRNHEKRLEEKR